jgi:adenine-specific DNA-methyltransferase
LDKQIKCGNSLISNDFYHGQQLGLLDEETIYRINAFDWETEFAEILQAGGFDAVIGNLPYGAFLSPDETEYLLKHFALQDYRLETYLLFLEKSLALVKEKGRIGLIIPNTWLLNLKSEKIRKYIFNHTTIQQVVHYRHRVFNKATVDTEIVIIQKQLPIETHQIDISLKEKEGRSINYVIAQKRGQMSDGKPVNIFERPEFTQIADKLRACQKLESLCAITQGAKPFQVGKGKPPQTREIVNKKPYVSEIPHNKTFRPLLRGRLIQRYEILWNNNYWISFGDWLAEPRYSANYDAPGKIVIRQTGYRLIATLDRNQFIVRDNLYTIVSRQNDFELRFLLGLINSRLLQWFYSKIINPEVGEALAQVKRGHLAQLPIVEVDLYNPIDKANYNKMVQLVEKMLNLHKQLATANVPQTKTVLTRQIEATDKQIDQLVYQLYCLTVEEIVIVEKS